MTIKQKITCLVFVLLLSLPGFAVRNPLDLSLILRPLVTTEGEFRLSGGYESGRAGSRLNVSGDGILAAKTRSGWFAQGAGMVNIAGDYKEFGVSLGCGYEPGAFGVFLFADSLAVLERGVSPSFHLQIRPAVRWTTNMLSAGLFYAKALTPDRLLPRVRVENGVHYGLFREAVDHFGLDMTLRLGKRLLVSGRGLLGHRLARVEASAGVRLRDNLSLDAGYSYTYSDGAIRGMGNHSRVFASITVGSGVASRFTDLEKRVILRPDYPIVRTVEKELGRQEPETFNVVLSATPLVGPAPLEVSFHAQPSGGRAPYHTEWRVAQTPDPALEGLRPNKTFAAKGDYEVVVRVTDADGKQALSNRVIIHVQPPATGSPGFTITASSGAGGAIDPAGAVSVPAGENRLFFMKPKAGFRVGRVLVDGTPVGAPASYQFESVDKDHTIHVEFTSALSRCYEIQASCGDGGFISPAGAVPVAEGSEASFAITPAAGFRVERVLVDGTDQGAVSDYRFLKIDANHNIHAQFAPQTYDITATSGSGGAVDPAGKTTVSSGGDLTIRVLPANGYDIASVVVDGKPAGAVSSYTFATIDGPHTLHATFSQTPAPSFTISASAGPGGAISPAGDVTVPQGTNATFLIRPKAGFRVASLTVDGDAQAAADSFTFQSVTADHTIHAAFAPITHTISCSSGPGGVTDPSGSITVNQGDNLAVSIRPDEAFIIQDVVVDGASVGAVSSYTFANITADRSLRATFKKKTFPITANAGPGGGIDPSGTIIAQYGDTMTFTITPNTGYAVDEVLVDNQPQGPVQSVTLPDIRGPHTIEARFKLLTFTIQAFSNAGGSISPNGTVIVNYGDSRAFRMQADNPQVYELENVIVDGKSQGPLPTFTFTNVTADHAIRALWKLRVYRIDASAGPGGSISPAGATYHAAGSTPTFNATPDPGFEIDRVVIDSAFNAGSSAAYTFDPIYSDHTIRVLFKKKTYTILIQKAFSDGSSSTPPNPVDPIGHITVTHGDTPVITIDNHFQGSDPSTVYSLDYISDNGLTTTYRGSAKSVITHTCAPVTAPKTITCLFYRRTN